MPVRTWIDKLDDTDKQGATVWGIFFSLVAIALLAGGAVGGVIAWVMGVVIGGIFLVGFIGICLYAYFGWMVPEGAAEKALVARHERRLEDRKLPQAVPDLDDLPILHRPETR